MSAHHDPQALEIKYLSELAEFNQAHVLEIGCGDGRLTWQFAPRAESVVATDPDPQRLALAQRNWPPDLRSSLSFAQARAEASPFPAESFDLVLMTWSF